MIGHDWTPDEIEVSLTKFPHSSPLEDDAIYQIKFESQEKSAQGFAIILRWDDTKQISPSNLKISPLDMIPHRSRKYRTISDLSFALKVSGWDIKSTKKLTKETSPDEVI